MLREEVADKAVRFPAAKKAKAFVRAIRVHQWIKNSLVFVPLVLAHLVNDPEAVRLSLVGFFAFSMCASGAYLLNDVLDVEADRQHHQKKFRPVAAGDLSIRAALIGSFLLLGSGLTAGLLLSADFMNVLVLYVALTLAYSIYLKQLVLVDVVLLASLYTIRIIAGTTAIGAPDSPWLLGFSIFFFLSLAFSKRYSELSNLKRQEKERPLGRGYRAGDLEQLARMGSASGYISILILALYINSDDVVALYAEPQRLWLICPFLIYWISRGWLVATRGELHEDPVIYALKDKASYFVGAVTAFILIMAS